MQILCFGDSNTYGFDPRSYVSNRYPAKDRWPDLLAEQTGYTVINAGVNGMSIPTASHALGMLAEYAQADMLLMMLGTNDLLQGFSAKEAAKKMETCISGILPRCKQITLIAPPPMKRGAWVPNDSLVSESCQLAEEYRSLAQKFSIAFADTQYWNLDLAYDGVHFTESGHHTFVCRLREVLDI